MKIVLVTDYYSEGMGYTENCLSKELAMLGHEVHVIASNLNVYGIAPNYKEIYESFLGPAVQECGSFNIDGYNVHRLPHRVIGGYILIKGMLDKIRELSPDIVQTSSPASYNTFLLALSRSKLNYRLFSDCHQHMSVVKSFLKTPNINYGKKAIYWITRTLPGYLASIAIEKCYTIAPDCAEVAHRFYGVPNKKIALLPLGTDTRLFHAASTQVEINKRNLQRKEFGFSEDDIVCIYTGRFSEDKDPLILGKAISRLRSEGMPFRGLFIGDGPPKGQLKKCSGTIVLPFVKHCDLAEYYRLADVGVWPKQESMSMLDAASSGLPLIVSNLIGERDRVDGNGFVYKEGDFESLAEVLTKLLSKEICHALGKCSREKMIRSYSWEQNAKERIKDYLY